MTPVPLDTQVGGHKGVLSSEDGSVIIKPCRHREGSFYSTLSSTKTFARLLPYVPKFYGTLKLHGKLDEQGNIASAEGVESGTDEACRSSLVLQNLSHTFSKPNILDIKLGTVLYDEYASPEKRARMEKTARETTSLETGVRLTAFNVYDYTEGKGIHTPKIYGKSIKAADLPVGVAKFFPLGTSDVPTGQGLPRDLLKEVLKGVITEATTIREVVSSIEMRMVGSSLLIVYEADWDILKQSLELWRPETVDAEEDSDEADDSDDTDDSGALENRPPYVVKLIDFAHTNLHGQGSDTGVILGLDTIIRLLKGRLEDISRQ
ncbi:SAICAR synthase-like protein [Hysterangium stoloniferum]|nr:SAICAR synthase-like protein [Hysterangium stoloniferum]